MPTVEARYADATAYARRAISAVETMFSYFVDPVTGVVEWYAGLTKTKVPRNELAHLEDRWQRSANEGDRAVLARQAELLADRIEETLPGAPQDRPRTNLFVGERAQSTAATSYADELEHQATYLWDGTVHLADRFTEGAATVGRWLMVSAGLVATWKIADYLRARERNCTGWSNEDTRHALNRRLAEVSAYRDAHGGGSYYVLRSDVPDAYCLVVGTARNGRALLVPLTDEARDLLVDYPTQSFVAADGAEGTAYVDSLAWYERVYKLPRWVYQ